MANLPNPRSYQQILGDAVDAFVSTYGIPAIRVGSPILSILEASSQSDLRNTQDQLNFLKATSLENATGTGLARQGADEGLAKITDSNATGSVTISDSSFTKVSSRIYQGTPAPIAGSTAINIVDGSSFAASGNIYLGRGTPNYEGPLAYSSITNNGTYWTIQLSGSVATQLFHNVGESVVLALGGDRNIIPGTVAQTPQGNATTAVQFSTLFLATIPDGETSINAVQVSAVVAGISGNVAAGAISQFVNPPFVGAQVTNPLPFTNATSQETDEAFRERIRATRASRTQGTTLAITNGVIGVTSTDENKRISSSSLVSPQGQTATLYIDDGTGYEEVSQGVGLETVVARAFGGEQYFTVASQPPVTKAAVTSLNSAPFSLVDASELYVAIGGLLVAPAVFSATQFSNINSATAFEVVAAINSQALPFSARVTDNGTTVTVFAKTDTAEGIEVVQAPAGVPDAGVALLFPAGEVDTMRLYKNDLLLSKDGQLAQVVSNYFSTWTGFGTSETLTIAIDGTAPLSLTFTAQDFANAGTGFTSVGANSLAAWAAVLNAQVTGATATVTGGQLTLVSNLGRSARASIDISSGSLVGAGKIFSSTVTPVMGQNNDYSLDRNTGQLSLVVPLVAGDTLSIGTTATRAFLQSPALAPVTIAAGGAKLYFVVDGQAEIVPTTHNASVALNFIQGAAENWGVRERIVSVAGSPIFANVLTGDWLILWDSDLAVSAGQPTNQGIFRVAYVDPSFTYVEIERQSMPVAAQNMQLVSLGNSAHQVLAVGGFNRQTNQPLNVAAVYTPSTGVWTSVAFMSTPRTFHQATLLANGSVLVTGGFATSSNVALNSCEIFSYTGTLGPSNIGSWAPAASMPSTRSGHSAFLIPSGPNVNNVAVAGGQDATGTAQTVGYRYNVGSNSWTTDGSLNTARYQSSAAYISSTGKFLIAGGLASPGSALASCELYDPTGNTWSNTGSMSTVRFWQGLVTLADNATVLAAGGNNNSGAVASSETFNGGTWTSQGSMSAPRAIFPLVLLGNGLVLATGSSPGAETYSSGSWTSVASPGTPAARLRGTGVTLNNGDALVVAGGNNTPSVSVSTSEIYDYTGLTWTFQTSFPVLTNQLLSHGGLTVVRTAPSGAGLSTPQVQTLLIPAGSNYTASSLSPLLGALGGASSTVFRTNQLRVNTNTFPVAGLNQEGGDIALVAADTQGQLLGLPVGGAVSNLTSHVAAAVATHSDIGTPSFINYTLNAALSATAINVEADHSSVSYLPSSGAFIVGIEDPTDAGVSRFGPNVGFSSTIHDVLASSTGNQATVTMRQAANVEWLPGDQVYAAAPLALGPQDTLTVVLDGDAETKRYLIPMYRRLTPATGSSYGQTITVRDLDNEVLGVPQSLAAAFGYQTGGIGGFDFSDFLVTMKARGLSHPGSTTKAILWRSTRFGADGNLSQIRYGYPTVASSPVGVVTDFLGALAGDALTGANTDITVTLATGAARTGVTIRPGSRVGVSVLAPNTSGNTSNRYLYTYIVGFSIATASSTGSATTLTLTMPPSILNHGFVIGNSVYVKSTNVGFASGLKTITGTGTSGGGAVDQITYASTDGAGTASNIGDVSYDTNEVTLNGSTVAVGDIATILPTTSLASGFVNITMSISSLGTQYFQGLYDTGTPQITPLWAVIGNTAGLTFYPLQSASNTIVQIVASVDALQAATNSVVPVTATAIGSGGTITQSSSDETGTPSYYYPFADGRNYVQSTSIPGSLGGNYTLTLKATVNATLAGNPADWADEEIRIVPITTSSLVAWLNTPAVSGLFNGASIVAANGGHQLQISTSTPGSLGSVQVQGGTANSVSAAVADFGVQISISAGNQMACSIQAAAGAGLSAHSWVAVQNTNAVPRATVSSGPTGTVLTNIVVNGTTQTATFTFDGSHTPIYTALCTVSAIPFIIHKEGNFVCYQHAQSPTQIPNLNTVNEGDWVYIYGGTYNTTPSVPFRVVRVDFGSSSFWVENPDATFSPSGFNSQVYTLSMVFVADGAVLPGDILKISTPAWGPGGSANQGTWVVSSVGLSGSTQYQNAFTFTVSLAPSSQVENPPPITNFGPTSISLTAQQANLIQIVEGTPSRLIKYITAICPNQVDGTLLSLKFDTALGYARVGINEGSLIQPLDKLAFPTTVATGIDGYSHSTGLVAAANQVVYGDPQDTATYPGIIASASDLNISGPLVKRIQVSLAIRMATSTSTPADVIARVQSSVAQLINQTGIGQPIALSDIVTAAGSVAGVTAVTLINPAMTVGNDVISVQPFEKPLVLDLGQDITVSQTGL